MVTSHPAVSTQPPFCEIQALESVGSQMPSAQIICIR